MLHVCPSNRLVNTLNELAILRPFWDTSFYPGCNVLALDNLIPYARNHVCFFK
jgi:hypothetical protein